MASLLSVLLLAYCLIGLPAIFAFNKYDDVLIQVCLRLGGIVLFLAFFAQNVACCFCYLYPEAPESHTISRILLLLAGAGQVEHNGELLNSRILKLEIENEALKESVTQSEASRGFLQFTITSKDRKIQERQNECQRLKDANSHQCGVIRELQQDICMLRVEGPVSIDENEILEDELRKTKTTLKAYSKEIDRLHIELKATKTRNGLPDLEAIFKAHESERTAWYEDKTCLEKTIEGQKQDIRQRDIELEKTLKELKVKTQGYDDAKAKNTRATSDLTLSNECSRLVEAEIQMLKAKNSDLAASENRMRDESNMKSRMINKIQHNLAHITTQAHATESNFRDYKEWCEKTHINVITQGKQDAEDDQMDIDENQLQVMSYPQDNSVVEMDWIPGPTSNNFCPFVIDMHPSTFDTEMPDYLEISPAPVQSLRIDGPQELQSNLLSRSLEHGLRLDNGLRSAPAQNLDPGTSSLVSRVLASTDIPMDANLSVAPTNNLPGLISHGQRQLPPVASQQSLLSNSLPGELGPDEWIEATRDMQEPEEDSGRGRGAGTSGPSDPFSEAEVSTALNEAFSDITDGPESSRAAQAPTQRPIMRIRGRGESQMQVESSSQAEIPEEAKVKPAAPTGDLQLNLGRAPLRTKRMFKLDRGN